VSDGGELLLPVFILHKSTVKATFNNPCELLGVIRRGSRGCCMKVGVNKLHGFIEYVQLHVTFV